MGSEYLDPTIIDPELFNLSVEEILQLYRAGEKAKFVAAAYERVQRPVHMQAHQRVRLLLGLFDYYPDRSNSLSFFERAEALFNQAYANCNLAERSDLVALREDIEALRSKLLAEVNHMYYLANRLDILDQLPIGEEVTVIVPVDPEHEPTRNPTLEHVFRGEQESEGAEAQHKQTRKARSGRNAKLRREGRLPPQKTIAELREQFAATSVSVEEKHEREDKPEEVQAEQAQPSEAKPENVQQQKKRRKQKNRPELKAKTIW